MVLVAILIWAIACILAAQAAPAAVLPPTANSVSATTALPSPRLTATATFATGSPSQTALQPGAQVAAPFLPHRTAMPVNASPYAKEQPDCGGVDHNLSSAVLAATATAPYATVTATSLPGHVIGGGGGGDENALCTELETLVRVQLNLLLGRLHPKLWAKR